MKTVKRFLLLPAVLAVAVCASAQQRVVALSGQDFVIDNAAAGDGESITYRWFRNGEAIANAVGASYTVPANLASMAGSSVYNTFGAKFQRAAYGVDCAGGVAMSNVIEVYFCDLIVNGVCWARANADANGRISANPYDIGSFYQWNRPNVAYSPTDPAAGVAVSGWNATPDNSPTWTNGTPCPGGWRLPTAQDIENLLAMESAWITGGVRGIPAGTNGKFFGFNTDYCTMSNMSGCVFLPAGGYRANANGALTANTGNLGYYWSGESTLTMATLLRIASANLPNYTAIKNNAFSVRCVQDVQNVGQ